MTPGWLRLKRFRSILWYSMAKKRVGFSSSFSIAQHLQVYSQTKPNSSKTSQYSDSENSQKCGQNPV